MSKLPNSFDKPKSSTCNGNCQSHSGAVKLVRVSSSWWKPMDFYYCDNAIAEDERRGFTVEVLKNE